MCAIVIGVSDVKIVQIFQSNLTQLLTHCGCPILKVKKCWLLIDFSYILKNPLKNASMIYHLRSRLIGKIKNEICKIITLS